MRLVTSTNCGLGPISDGKLRPLSGMFCTNCWFTTALTAGETSVYWLSATCAINWIMDPTFLVKFRARAPCISKIKPLSTIYWNPSVSSGSLTRPIVFKLATGSHRRQRVSTV